MSLSEVPWWGWVLLLVALRKLVGLVAAQMGNRGRAPLLFREDLDKTDDPAMDETSNLLRNPFVSMLHGQVIEMREPGEPSRFVHNPYRMIMMYCPKTEKPVQTGINSAYFEEWKNSPPPNGASFLCPQCQETHHFDRENTWLEDLGD